MKNNYEKYIEGDSIIKKEGSKPGKTLAIFAGVHGNEKAGVIALSNILDDIKIEYGTVYFVFANPPAIKENVRQINKNLNRCFIKNHSGNNYEDQRAIELMEILDKCDVSLDLHSSNTPGSTPFIICEENGFDFAKKLDVSIISTGWDAIEPGGTDGYMYQTGKIGICAECGYAGNSNRYIKFTEELVTKFLKFYESIPRKVENTNIVQKNIHVDRIIIKKDKNFSFVKKFKDFEKLPKDYEYAKANSSKYISEENDIIIFARENVRMGGEACILGKEIKNPTK